MRKEIAVFMLLDRIERNCVDKSHLFKTCPVFSSVQKFRNKIEQQYKSSGAQQRHVQGDNITTIKQEQKDVLFVGLQSLVVTCRANKSLLI